MNCDEVRDELVAYARHELSAERNAAVERHLVCCPECTRELEGARQVMALTQVADAASTQAKATEILHAALARRASDIHLERDAAGPRLRFRIDGVLQVQKEPLITPEQYEPVIDRFKRVAEQNLSEKRVPQDGRFKFAHEGKEYDVRMSTFPYLKGESVVMRLLDQSGVLIGLNRLGMADAMKAQIERLLDRRQGLLLTTGPTGAGKSTFLYSLLNRLNTPEIKMMTIEDPVEYLLPGVNQAQVLRRAGLTFATAMRAFMRQDPDVIMVAELRDLETAEMAIQASLTGHLVFSVLHTPDTITALSRLQDIGAQAFLVASTLIGVVGQRLVRKVCPACREAYEPAEPLLAALGLIGGARPATFLHGRGCEQCAYTGYHGRTGLFELLTITKPLASMLAGREPEAALRARALELGLLWSFAADARAKIRDGITTPEEVDRVLPGLAGGSAELVAKALP